MYILELLTLSVALASSTAPLKIFRVAGPVTPGNIIGVLATGAPVPLTYSVFEISKSNLGHNEPGSESELIM